MLNLKFDLLSLYIEFFHLFCFYIANCKRFQSIFPINCECARFFFVTSHRILRHEYHSSEQIRFKWNNSFKCLIVVLCLVAVIKREKYDTHNERPISKQWTAVVWLSHVKYKCTLFANWKKTTTKWYFCRWSVERNGLIITLQPSIHIWLPLFSWMETFHLSR